MSFANASVSDIIATTIEKRSKKIADNVRKNNAILTRLEARGKARTDVRPFCLAPRQDVPCRRPVPCRSTHQRW